MTEQEKKESAYELQLIDCNCNDCFFMQRDFEAFKKWELWNSNLQEIEFKKKKQEALEIAKATEDEKGRNTLLNKANKMKFQFDRGVLLTYGKCLKYNKDISFIPATCQIETQKCFIHRKDYLTTK